MVLEVDEELRLICETICSKQMNIADWTLVESDDEFQSAKYCGGFDATEGAFCFGLYDDKGNEYWFQFTLEDAEKIAKSGIRVIAAREAS